MPIRVSLDSSDAQTFPARPDAFIASLTALLRLTNETRTARLLEESAIEIACRDYDNLDGGTFGWSLRIRVPLAEFARFIPSEKTLLEGKVKEASTRLFQEHDHHYVTQVLIVAAPAETAVSAATFAKETGFPSRQTFYAARELDEVGILGHGGFGSVVHVTRQRINMSLAVKFFAPHPFNAGSPGRLAKARQRLAREAALLAAIRHPGVVRLLDFSLIAGDPVLVLEYIDGKTLDAIRHEKGPLPLDTARRLMREVLQALAACHSASVVHRDVSPKNVIVENSGRAVLIDFGLGFSEELISGERLTSQALGTPCFRAPELDHDPLSTTPAVDVFSAGALAAFLLTGRAPQVGVRLDIDGVPAPLLSALRQALAPDPSQRLRSVQELFDAFAPPSMGGTSPPAHARSTLSGSEVREFMGIGEAAELQGAAEVLVKEFSVAVARTASTVGEHQGHALATLLVAARHQLDLIWETPRSSERCEEDEVKAAFASLYALLHDLPAAPPPPTVDKAFDGAVGRGWLRTDSFDAWHPGMASGTGWRDCYRPTALGRRWLSGNLGFKLPEGHEG